MSIFQQASCFAAICWCCLHTQEGLPLALHNLESKILKRKASWLTLSMCLQTNALAFMLPLGLGIAVAVRWAPVVLGLSAALMSPCRVQKARPPRQQQVACLRAFCMRQADIKATPASSTCHCCDSQTVSLTPALSRVANEVGAGRPREARHAAAVAVRLAFFLAGGLGLTVLLARCRPRLNGQLTWVLGSAAQLHSLAHQMLVKSSFPRQLASCSWFACLPASSWRCKGSTRVGQVCTHSMW